MIFGWSLPVAAGLLNFNLTTNVQARYSDNVFFSTENTESDYCLRISPGIRSGWKTEAMELRFSGFAHIYRYQENEELDTVDQIYSADYSRQWNPRFATAVSASFLVDERRDRELSETGLLFDDDRRWKQAYHLSGQYQLSELSQMSLSYGFQVEDYHDDTNYDTTIHTIQLLISRNLASILENSTGRLQAIGGFYEYRRDYETTDSVFNFYSVDMDDQQDIDYYSFKLGLGYRWTEKLNLTFDAGARFTKTNQSAASIIEPNPFGMTGTVIEEENESTGFVAMFQADYSGEKAQFSVQASHDLVPASGLEGAAERSTLRLAVQRRLSTKWSFDCSARTYLNRSDESDVTSDKDELTLLFRTGLKYAFHPMWHVRAAWQTYWIEDRQNHVDKRQNIVTLRLDWNWSVLD
jgi:hypothetical protein